jgi:hypothetical protein
VPAPAAAKPEVAGYDDLVPQTAAQGPVKVEDLPTSTDVHELMRIMAANSGHLERGGLAAGSQSQVPIKGAKSQAEMNEEGTGRTVWVGQPPWASGLGMSVKQIETAVDKAIRGKHLGKKQRTVVEAMLQELHDMRTEIDQTPAPQAWGTLTEEQKDAELDQMARPDAIRAAMRALFGAPINEKHQGSKNLGIYRIKPQTIRLQNRNDLRTAAHEVGHHISNRNKPFRAVMRQHAASSSRSRRAAYKQQIGRAGKPMAAQAPDRGGLRRIHRRVPDEPRTRSRRRCRASSRLSSVARQNPLHTRPRSSRCRHDRRAPGALPEDKILAKVGAFKPTLRERAARS